jgi:TM2 domain-containing membrane protein YozV
VSELETSILNIESKHRFRLFSGFVCFCGFLIPGLGHFLQRRFFKAFLFLFSIYFLFFYGWALSSYQNVYLPRASECQPRGKSLTSVTIGPLSIPFPKCFYYRLQFVGQLGIGIVSAPAVIQFLFVDEEVGTSPPLPLIGTVMRAPPEAVLNQLQTEGTIVWELAWVFTVSAGLLNLLAAYDTLFSKYLV